MLAGNIQRQRRSAWTHDVYLRFVRHSEDALIVFWTFYVALSTVGIEQVFIFCWNLFSLQKNINSRWEKWSNLSVVKSKALKCPYNFFLAFLMLILTSYWSDTTRNQLKFGRYSLWKRGDFQDLNASTEYTSFFKDNWRQYDRKLSVFLLL